ncbi:hypothetical protein BJY52DRAFT_1300766 [Lactarius psammicola]|nr:hypothetical protein BJY52DRAFT_1300766 [Lactarius psammicola]
MDSSAIAIPMMLATFFVLALYFTLLRLEVHLVTIVETTPKLDSVNMTYRVVAPKNNPDPSYLYSRVEFVVRLSASKLFHSSEAEVQDKRIGVDSSGGGQDATTSPPGPEDDAVSMLSELTEISEPRVPRDSEPSEYESEEDVPLAEIHRLKRNSSGVSSPRTQTYHTSPGSLIPHTTFQTMDGVDCSKDATYNVFESIGEAETVTPPFLPKYLVIPYDLYIHRWSGGVQAWIFSADGWSELRAGDAHPVFSDRRFFIRRSEPPRWLKMNTYSRTERSAMRFAGIRYRP